MTETDLSICLHLGIYLYVVVNNERRRRCLCRLLGRSSWTAEASDRSAFPAIGSNAVGDSLQANPKRDCRNSTNHAPATNNRKPGLVPGFFVPAVSAVDVRLTPKSRHSGIIGAERLLVTQSRRTLSEDFWPEVAAQSVHFTLKTMRSTARVEHIGNGRLLRNSDAPRLMGFNMTTRQKREAVQNMLMAALRDLRSGKSFVCCYSNMSIALKFSTNTPLMSSKGGASYP